jgi:hypothetical protein
MLRRLFPALFRTLPAIAWGLALAVPAAGWDFDDAAVESFGAWATFSESTAWDPFPAEDMLLAWEPTGGVAGPVEPPAVAFEGFGLAGFQGSGSVKAALRRCRSSMHKDSGKAVEFCGIDVRGPGRGQAGPGPLAAELRSRIDKIDISAGMAANPERIEEGPSRWTGRIGLTNDRETGSESLEVRTMLAPSDERSIVGVTVGPRVERHLRRGLTVFVDGQAEARAFRAADTGWWGLPGTTDSSLAMLGVTARTGIMR